MCLVSYHTTLSGILPTTYTFYTYLSVAIKVNYPLAKDIKIPNCVVSSALESVSSHFSLSLSLSL